MVIAAAQLLIFLKAPRPGRVKSRLARALGPEQACAIYRQLLGHLIGNLSGLGQVELHFTPSDGFTEVQPWLQPGWIARPQAEGDLGQRMHAAFTEAFERGARPVALIGSDCPTVTSVHIHQAWTQLQQHDLVLGPASDGGYWLIALNRPSPALFEGIAWSSTQVLEQTLARAHSVGLTHALLETMSDIDTETDWRRFQARA